MFIELCSTGKQQDKGQLDITKPDSRISTAFQLLFQWWQEWSLKKLILKVLLKFKISNCNWQSGLRLLRFRLEKITLPCRVSIFRSVNLNIKSEKCKTRKKGLRIKKSRIRKLKAKEINHRLNGEVVSYNIRSCVKTG